MKQPITLCIVLLMATASIAQSKYETGMQKAFELWEADKPWEAANVFERIAGVESDNWLPPYYVSQINVINSFNEKDEIILKAQLDKALDYLNRAKTISKDNAELLVLEAQYYTAWIAYDGQKYGMKYAGKVAELYNKAAQLAPDNPRVVLGKAEWDMGSAQFFGQSMEPYCNDVERAIGLFETFEPETGFHPSYGRDRAQEILKTNCKK